MMADVIINNMQNKIEVSKELEDLIAKVINAALLAENVSGDVEVSIVLVDDEYIQNLNKNYRSIDAPTDVLSFAMRESVDESDISFECEEEELLGDVVISLERARSQAEEYGHSIEREIGFLVTHGILHLLGYDHETESERAVMRNKEEKILESIGLTR
ncbi:endoribonuclease YbeY [Tepidanaerobacter syntrophicus]|uniref:Endoribonuclease YbeY n=2 Tax=Tepidanaerobacter TaxID=499228 RepID=A0A0U9HMI4_9FIRM|nr:MULTISPECIES: rRNA maturation RNase YbeY [Tepidanaerobacter]GAQ25539.1 probable rRNA maturation factor [Tepidanaerobacter syntrophicus]GLI50003.1 endoribonuclease YbeY [Tepidanaerobacter syntrophicus]